MSDLRCFYTQKLNANGSPFIYNMINYTGIAGGTGPTGSIKSKNKSVAIPRSKKAQHMHALGFSIKLIFFIALLFLLPIRLISFSSSYEIILFSIFFLMIGGLLVHLLYYITKVKSKLFHSGKYPEIIKLEEKDYTRGGHVVISSTPLGTLVFISRWVF